MLSSVVLVVRSGLPLNRREVFATRIAPTISGQACGHKEPLFFSKKQHASVFEFCTWLLGQCSSVDSRFRRRLVCRRNRRPDAVGLVYDPNGYMKVGDSYS